MAAPHVCVSLYIKIHLQVSQSSVSNSKPRHVKPGSLATRQVIHVTMSDTSQCHVTNTAQDQQDDVKKSVSVVSAATSLATKSSEATASSDTRNDPGSPVAYQLVEQVYFTHSV